MNIDLNDKVAIVTGAAQGIGKTIAKRFAQEGVKLSLWDINEEKLCETQNQISNIHEEIISLKTDVGKEEDIKNSIEATIKEFGTIDILVANAGVAKPNKFLDISSDEWDDVYHINTKGVFLCSKAVAPIFKQKKNGRIIIASSFAAIIPSVDMASYSSSKAAVVSLTRVMAAELGPWNITVNSYAPGMIPTNMSNIENLTEKRKQEMLDTLSIREWGKKDDIASLIIFLASDQARYITGTNIDASGGKFSVQFANLARD